MRLTSSKRFLKRAVLPLTLSLTMLLGGSSVSAELPRLWLSFFSLVLLIILIPHAAHKPLNRRAKFALLLLSLWLIWCSLQLVPVPHWLWSKLGDRAIVESGLELLGLSAEQPLPISLSPRESRLSLAASLPPIAVFLMIIATGDRRIFSQLNWIIPILGAISAIFGIAQVSVVQEPDLYLYEVTSIGSAVGFFANANHQACFLIMCLPFMAANIRNGSKEQGSGDAYNAKLIACISLFLLILIGILTTGSGAGYLLLIPTLLLSLLIGAKSLSSKKMKIGLPLILLATIVFSALIISSNPTLTGPGVADVDASRVSRVEMWKLSLEAAADHWLVGTGLGSFHEVYSLYEEPYSVTRAYANQAHNDYLQIVIELGLPGIMLSICGIVFFCRLFLQVWFRQDEKLGHQRRAAASALLVVLLHSVVDYSLRTPAVCSLAAACFALLLVSPRHVQRRGGRSRVDRKSSDQKQRHRVI